MFVVEFHHVDRTEIPDEYYYARLEDAEVHFKLFQDDTSGLYSRVVLINLGTKPESVLAFVSFP